MTPDGAGATTEPAEPEPGENAAELPLDVVYHVLSNARRRRIIRYLLSVSTSTTLGELTEYVASLENEKPAAELTSTERKRVYVCLYQSHLPKLHDVDAIDFDRHRKDVEAAENLLVFARFLPGGGPTDSRRATRTDRGSLVARGRRFLDGVRDSVR